MEGREEVENVVDGLGLIIRRLKRRIRAPLTLMDGFCSPIYGMK